MREQPWIWSTWVKTTLLKGAEILIASACLPIVNPRLFEELSKGKVVLLACPERESAAYYGKIASMIRSVKPKKITVVTIDGSPHCFALQASVNEAEYILGERVEREHYVVLDGEELKKISPDAVRIARYLSLVNKLITQHPEVLEELSRHSLEYAKAKELG
ncbi:4Fe-4S ferredoxin [Thermogladius sp. 4427co]|uniref:4Fe-4S ferredoxin n=1 Tax=Thermogladius sp. 4427co TaxID=3450718 RepID=UPI003F794E36